MISRNSILGMLRMLAECLSPTLLSRINIIFQIKAAHVGENSVAELEHERAT